MLRCAVAAAFITGVLAGNADGYQYTHEVLPGETLASVAKRYQVSPTKIRRQNRIRKNHLRVGQKLKVVTSYPCRQQYRAKYKIKSGDSLFRIAKKHKMSLGLLKRLNPKTSSKPLRPGRSMWVVIQGPRPTGGAKGMYQLTSGPGYKVRVPSRAWGQFLTITRLIEVLGGHTAVFPRARSLLIGDLSRRQGGYLEPHVSHRRGRDVDIRYPLTFASKHFVNASEKTLDKARTLDLIERFIETEDVTYIFMDYRLQRVMYEYAKQQGPEHRWILKHFQYPRGKRDVPAIIRHEKGHATHLHVRFRQEKAPPVPIS